MSLFFFRFVFIRCFSSSWSLVRSVTFRFTMIVKEKKKCVYRLNVFAIALVLFVPRFLFIFFFSLSFRSRSDIYFSITVYEDRLYHGLSVLARFTFCASECFSPSLSLSLCPTMVSFHPPEIHRVISTRQQRGRSNRCLRFNAINLRCGSIDQSYPIVGNSVE